MNIMINFAHKVYTRLFLACELIFHFLKRGFNRDESLILLDLKTQKQRTILNKKQQRISPKKQSKLFVIIPFKDQWDLTQKCLDGLVCQKTDSISLNIILVDNNSSSQKTFDGIKAFKEKFKETKVLKCPCDFNFSYINNFAVNSIHEDGILWFLNNDISFISQGALLEYYKTMTSYENIGALGSTLLYPESTTIQHLFLAPGVKICGAHPLKGKNYKKNSAWFREKFHIVPAVTGASLMIQKKLFLDLGGFDEKLKTSCQDLDLCLKITESTKLYNLSLTHTALIHHESKTRKKTFNKEEIYYFYKKWDEKLFQNPFWNSQFSTWSEKPILKTFSKRYPWRKHI